MRRWNQRRWVMFELNMLVDYELYWEARTKASWLLWFNGQLCIHLILYYQNRLATVPPVFNPWYVRLCHRYYRWRCK